MLQIVDYKPFKPKEGTVSFLKGFVRIRISTDWGMLMCNDLQVFSKYGKHWVNFPAKRIEDSEGVKHFSYCRYEEKEDSDRFSAAVIEALKAWSVANKGGSTDPQSLPRPSENKQPSQATETVSMDPALGNQVKVFQDVPF